MVVDAVVFDCKGLHRDEPWLIAMSLFQSKPQVRQEVVQIAPFDRALRTAFGGVLDVVQVGGL
jgi:hypothetical protein